MSLCENGKLHALLILVHKIKPVKYSVEKQKTLWDGGDRVEEKERRFYVTLRHFNGEIIGRHVALIENVEKLEDEWGERRTYRLPVGTRASEHLVVYVYNPAVCENGTLSFYINTTDTHAAAQTQTVSVAPDNCQAVLKFDCQNMQKGHVTHLISRDDNYLVELRIFLGG
jgi:hypothetical protein